MENKDEFNKIENVAPENDSARDNSAHYVPFDSSASGSHSVSYESEATEPRSVETSVAEAKPVTQQYVPYGEGFSGQSLGSFGYDDTLLQKRREIKRLGNGIGLPLSLFVIGSGVLGLIVSSLLMLILGVSKYYELAANPNFLYVVSGALSIVLFTLPFAITSGFIGAKWSELLPFCKPKNNSTLPVVMLGMGACALGNFATSIFATFLNMVFGIVPQTSLPEYGTGSDSFVLMLLCVGVLPALVEEFAFRGVVLGALRRYFGDGAAILISAVLFGLIHGNLQQIPFAFCVGIVLAYATVYTSSIIPAMIIHALNNSLSVVLSFASSSMSPGVNAIVSCLYLLVLLLLGLCGSIILMKADSNAFKLEKKADAYSNKYLGWFSTSGWMIVFVILCILSVISVQMSAVVG